MYFIYLFCCTEVWTQGLTLASQVLYDLSHAASPFCFFFGVLEKQALYSLNHDFSLLCPGYFGDGGLENYFLELALTMILLISVFQVANIQV
jgi:hypothetical protein